MTNLSNCKEKLPFMHKKYLPQIFCILLANIYLLYIKNIKSIYTILNQYHRINKLDKKTKDHFSISCNAFASFNYHVKIIPVLISVLDYLQNTKKHFLAFIHELVNNASCKR